MSNEDVEYTKIKSGGAHLFKHTAPACAICKGETRAIYTCDKCCKHPLVLNTEIKELREQVAFMQKLLLQYGCKCEECESDD